MARYRAKSRLFVRRYILPGETFESELPPGRNWEPLDDEAKARVAAEEQKRGPAREIAERLDPAPREAAAVDIPAEWRELPPRKMISLARRLGAGRPNNAQAVAWIEKEIERRSAPVQQAA